MLEMWKKKKVSEKEREGEEREGGGGGEEGGRKNTEGVAMEMERFPGCFLWQVLSGAKVLKQNPACTPKVKELWSLPIAKRERSKWILRFIEEFTCLSWRRGAEEGCPTF